MGLGTGLELLLNLAAILIAIAAVCFWLRIAPENGRDRRTQVVALILLLLILFPTISITDDLLAIQNPAETDNYVCLDYLHYSDAHYFWPVAVEMVEPVLEEHCSGFLREAVPGTLTASVMNPPALAPIENRPPPVA